MSSTETEQHGTWTVTLQAGPELKQYSLIELVMEQAELPLYTVSAQVLALRNGEPMRCTFPTQEAAEQFAAEATAFGVSCTVEQDTPDA